MYQNDENKSERRHLNRSSVSITPANGKAKISFKKTNTLKNSNIDKKILNLHELVFSDILIPGYIVSVMETDHNVLAHMISLLQIKIFFLFEKRKLLVFFLYLGTTDIKMSKKNNVGYYFVKTAMELLTSQLDSSSKTEYKERKNEKDLNRIYPMNFACQ